MASAAELVIRVLADTTKAQAGLDATASKASKMGAGVRKMAAPAAAGLLAIGAAAVSAGNAAAEDAQAQALLATSMENNAGAHKKAIAATEEYIGKLSEATGITDDELRPAMAGLVRATGDTEKSQYALATAIDVAAATGKSVESVSAAMAKGFNGSAASLKKLVPGLDEAAVEAGNMDIIMGQLADKTGGSAAAAADTAAGKMKIMSTAMGEAQEEIGTALLPAMAMLAEHLSTAAAFASKHSGAVQILAVAIAGLAAAVLVINAAMKVYQATLIVVQAVQKATWLSNPIGLVIVAVIALVAAVVLLWKKSETFRTVVLATWSAIKTGAAAVAAFIKTALKAAFGFAEAYVRAYLAVVRAVFNAVMAVIRGLIGFVSGVMNTVKGAFSSGWDAVRNGAVNAWNAITGAIERAVNRVLDTVRAMPGKIKGFFTGAATMLTTVGQDIIRGLISGIDSGIQWVRDKIEQLAAMMPGWLKKKLGIASPSKVIAEIGKDVMRGMEAGMEAGMAGVEAVADKVATQIGRVMEKRFKSDKRAAIASRAAIKMLDDETEAMKRNAKKREKVYADLAAAQDALTKAQDAKQAYFESIQSATLAFGAVTNLADKEATSSDAIIADMRKRLVDAQRFTTLIQSLTAQGLDKQVIADLTAAGVDGGLATAEGLAAGGPAAIAEVNSIQTQLGATATALGESTAATMHDAGIASAQALVDGLVLDQAALEATADRMAEALADAISKAIKRAIKKAKNAAIGDEGGGGGGGSTRSLAPVVPLHPGVSAAVAPSVPSARASAMSGGGTGPTIIVNGAIDPESTARQIRRILAGHDRRQGLAS